MVKWAHHLLLSLFDFYDSLVHRSANIVAHTVTRWNSDSLGKVIHIYPFSQSHVTLTFLDLI